MTHIMRINEMQLKKVTSVTLRDFMENLENYFKVSCTTHESFFTDVYKRLYTFNVDNKKSNENTLTFRLTSKDYVPSGFGKSGSDKTFGNFELTFDEEDLNSDAKTVLMGILKDIDTPFWNKYNSKLNNDSIVVIRTELPNF